MKMLNLDTFAKEDRTITIKGVVYDVQEMTVENFIETTKAIEALEDKEKQSNADQIETTIDMILRSVPKLPRDILRTMSLDKMAVIAKFLRGEMDEEITKSVESANTEGGEEGKQ